MPSLDIFNNDAFGVVELTKAINTMPFVPGRIGKLGLFEESGISTTSLMIEKMGTTLSLVPAAIRGSSGLVANTDKRSMIPIGTTHLPQRASVLADEVQNVRAFGSQSDVQTVQDIVNQKLAKMRRNLDATIEFQRMGALKGIVVDSDGSTPLLNLFTAFGVSQQTISFATGTAGTSMLAKIRAARRLIEVELGASMYTSLRVLCSPGFFDAFTGHANVEKFYLNWQQASALTGDTRGGFAFGGPDVIFEEYRGTVSGVPFITDGEAYMIPEGVPDLFITNYAPADYMETVNTLGLPYYAKQELMDFNKGTMIEAQSNPISICTRPRTVLKITES